MFQFLKSKSVHVISVLCVYMCTVHIHTHNEKCRRAEKEMLYPVSVIYFFGIFWYLFLFLEICHVYLFCLILESLFLLCFGFSPIFHFLPTFQYTPSTPKNTLSPWLLFRYRQASHAYQPASLSSCSETRNCLFF